MKKLLLILFAFFSFNAVNAQQLWVSISALSPLSCNTDAVIAVYGNEGVAPYEYSVNNGVTFQASTMFTLPSGTYQVVVRDAAMTTVTQSFTINPVPPVVVNTVVVNPLCFGSNTGAIIANATGGQGSYLYSILAPITIGPSASNTFSNLSPGNYAVGVTDASGCSTVTNVVIFQPPMLSATVALDASQTTATVTAFGGIPPYSYSIDGMMYLPTGVFPNLTQGVYNFIVTDANGCFVMNTFAINSPLQLAVNSAYVDYNNDGFTSVGDVINYQFTVTNNGTLPITNITLSDYGFTHTGGPIASLAPGTSDSTTFTGQHVLDQYNINNGSFALDIEATGTYNNGTVTNIQTPVTPFSISDGIKLNAFIDANNNGVQDPLEQNFTLGDFHYELNDNGTVHNITSTTGTHYIYENNPANSFDVSFTVNGDYTSQYSVATSVYSNITIAAGSGIITYNFPVTVLGYKDLVVHVLPFGTSPRPGFVYANQIVYKNNGNLAIAAGTLTFTKNNAVAITNVSPAATTNTATGFTYDFTNLAPGEIRTVYVSMQVPTIPTVALGNVLTNTVSGIVSGGGDIYLSNNYHSLSQVIVGSYDPNDKTEAYGGKIVHSTFTSNDYLTYTIQFENTGTANAVNVRVNDVLDAQLDETTIKMINASHNYTLDRVGNNLNWNFDGIELPPSVINTTTGKGYITFQVKPKAGFSVGDIIPNTASIFFDFNPAIVTNTFMTEFVAALGTPEFENAGFKVYPNPTKNVLTITLQNNAEVIDAVTVSDITGKTVKTQKGDNASVILDVSDLSKGIYFVKVQSEGQQKVLKVVKE